MNAAERLQLFRVRLGLLQNGYCLGEFEGRSYGISVSRPVPGVVKLYAEELGGTDVVSFNHYTPEGNVPVLRPCEMSSDKVIDFVLGVRLDQD